MKFRFIKLGAIFMTAVTVLTGTGTMAARASSIRAGVSDVLTECLNENAKTMAAKENVGKNAKLLKTANVPVQKKDTAKAEKRSKKIADPEDNTICGYTNLGIANVSNYLNVREEAGEDAKIVGKLPADAGCEILDTQDGGGGFLIKGNGTYPVYILRVYNCDNGKEYTYRVLSKNFTCYNSNFNITPSSFYFGIDVSVTNQAVTVSGVADTY